MKKLAIAAMAVVLIMGLGAGSASAASSSSSSSLKAGTLGFNVGFGDSVFGNNGVVTISGKYFITSDLAIVGGVGSQFSSGDLDSDFSSLSGGARKYFRTDDFSPFVEGKFTYAHEKNTVDNNIDKTAFDLSFIFGGEYFLHRQFSIEAGVGVGFGTVSVKSPTSAPSQDYTYFGTRTVGVSANFYF